MARRWPPCWARTIHASCRTWSSPIARKLAAALGRPLDSREALLEAARELVARGIRHVAVSLGEQGAFGLCTTGSAELDGFHAAPLQVPVASTVGAGDA
ncbi:PfkB family carbohydrate kinase, partial [Burkholderia gladioli]|uniref:PfkB family carbohydrate kinase n=1 Tax=Burkholderia gladioli TaxID=28095 RepID=UPI003D1D4F54